MSKFTSSERLGTILLILLMVIIIAVMAFLRNVDRPVAPLPIPPQSDSVTCDTSKSTTTKRASKKKSTSKTKKAGKATKKRQSVPQPQPRNHLDEPIEPIEPPE